MGPTYHHPSSFARIGSSKKEAWHPGASMDSDTDAATHLNKYRLHRHDASKRSIVARYGDEIIPRTSVWSSSSLLMRRRNSAMVDECRPTSDQKCNATKENVPKLRSASSVDDMALRRTLAAVRRESTNDRTLSSCLDRREASAPPWVDASTMS